MLLVPAWPVPSITFISSPKTAEAGNVSVLADDVSTIYAFPLTNVMLLEVALYVTAGSCLACT